MIWNFLAAVDPTVDAADLFPQPAENRIGIAVTASDDSIHVHAAEEVVISREVEGQGFRPLISVRGGISFVLTDTRVAVITSGPIAYGGPLPSTAGVLASDNSQGGATQRPVVGHVELSNISLVGVAATPQGAGQLFFQVDDTVSDEEADRGAVMIETFFLPGVDVAEVGSQLLARIVRDRIADPGFARFSDRFEDWRALAAQGLQPTAGRYATAEITPHRGVRRRSIDTAAGSTAEGSARGVEPWELLTVVGEGVDTGGGDHPVPAGDSVVLQPGEHVVLTREISRLVVLKADGPGDWQEVQRIGFSDGQLIITDRRVVMVYPAVPKPTTGTGVSGAAPPIESDGVDGALVGHVWLGQVAALGARDRAKGLSNHTYTCLVVEDGSQPSVTSFTRIHISTKGFKLPSDIANELLPLILRSRAGTGAALGDLDGFRFRPRGEEVQLREVPGHEVVRGRPLAGASDRSAAASPPSGFAAPTAPVPAAPMPPTSSAPAVAPTPMPPPPPAPAPLPPPTWAADPFGRFEQRYWDGREWTAHVSTNGVQSTDPPTPVAQ